VELNKTSTCAKIVLPTYASNCYSTAVLQKEAEVERAYGSMAGHREGQEAL